MYNEQADKIAAAVWCWVSPSCSVMPGVLSSNSSSDFSREVGKMASSMLLDIKLEDGPGELEDLANYLLSSSSDFSISGNFSRDFVDSDSDLPDNELPVDFIKLLDCPDIDVGPKLHRIKCEDGCNSCGESPNKYSKYRVSDRQDPFMGTGGMSDQSKESGRSSTILEQLMNPLDYDSEYEELMRPKVRDTKTFSAWYTPKAEDELDFVQPKSSTNIWRGVFNDNTDEDDDDDDDDDDYDSSSQDVTFPDTPSPSTQSETVGGDDSDVDIETVTDAPRSADSCGYSSHLSPAMSPSSPGPLQKLRGGSLLTILSASVTPNGRISAHSSASATAAAMSRSSLAGNLLSNRSSSLLGQKRKLSKDKNVLSKTPMQSSYQHVLCTSNSVNFHDYAMSPGACTYPSPSSSSSSSSSSTETGRPTVLSKRIYKRKQFSMDASEKEKQHHHNQLERNRRQKLADLFMDLRDEVPKIANQAKASKVLILNEAAFYIHDLKNQHRHQEDEISREQRRKEVLRNQLRSLQAQISSSG